MFLPGRVGARRAAVVVTAIALSLASGGCSAEDDAGGVIPQAEDEPAEFGPDEVPAEPPADGGR